MFAWATSSLTAGRASASTFRARRWSLDAHQEPTPKVNFSLRAARCYGGKRLDQVFRMHQSVDAFSLLDCRRKGVPIAFLLESAATVACNVVPYARNSADGAWCK